MLCVVYLYLSRNLTKLCSNLLLRDWTEILNLISPTVNSSWNLHSSFSLPGVIMHLSSLLSTCLMYSGKVVNQRLWEELMCRVRAPSIVSPTFLGFYCTISRKSGCLRLLVSSPCATWGTGQCPQMKSQVDTGLTHCVSLLWRVISFPVCDCFWLQCL